MQIRNAVADDAELIVNLVNRLIEELGGARLPVESAALACRQMFAEQRAFALIAEDNGKALGVCTLSFQESIRTLGKYAIVQEMYVIPESRGRSLGAEIMESAISEARSHGCRTIELGTPPNGERQERFYERLGFDPVGLRMRKTLG